MRLRGTRAQTRGQGLLSRQAWSLDPVLSQDIVQDAFLKAHMELRTLRNTDSFVSGYVGSRSVARRTRSASGDGRPRLASGSRMTGPVQSWSRREWRTTRSCAISPTRG